MEKIAIVGAGLIGRAWAIVFARAGRPVTLYDPDSLAAVRARKLIRASLDDLAAAGLIDEPAAAIAARVVPMPTLAETVAEADYVQENSPERLDLKIALFAELDRLASADAILASSTSGMPASAFSERLAGRARCLVAHPVNPPYLLPLVEISPAPWTAPEIVARTRSLHESVGQSPIVIRREIDGFILNRLQGALLAEAFRLVEDGYVSTADVDKTLKDALGLRWSFMGPFETIDLNAPGGLRDYVDRYGSLYYEMAKSQADPRPWSSAL
ncbi:MAG TPA: 3-hydroxyacyl-CoA dehydrogenase, partial [Alphaproteobacteria bacterium]|nr:3-hydroxyacyl-CoA dehydrogenase [Alphaproteobacteria bacterium]